MACSTRPRVSVPRLQVGLGLCTLWVACALVLWPWSAAAGQRPNIIVILADDLGYGNLSFAGATDIRTPNIDRLAETGVVFSSGYVASPTCGPSRAGLITGRHPSRFGMETIVAHAPGDHGLGLPVEETTVATRLRKLGYRTGIVGKWHLGSATPFHPLNRGFDFYFGFPGGDHDYFRTDTTRPEIKHLTPIDDNGVATGIDGYLTDVLTDRAIEFVHDAAGEPYFLYLTYNAPHWPFQAPDDLVEKYAQVPEPKRRRYLAMIDSLDHNVGRLVAALEQSGQRDNTVIFFLSDNGGLSGLDNEGIRWGENGPFRAGKGAFYEGGIRVPFIASWPGGWPQGMRFGPMVSSLDISVTALALGGTRNNGALEGVNLHPFIVGEVSGEPHGALFWRWHDSPEQSKSAFAVRSGNMKLVKAHIGGETELYDLEADPGETVNLIGSDPATARRLAERWNNWNRKNPSRNLFPDQYSYLAQINRDRRKIASNFKRRAEELAHFEIGIGRDSELPSCSSGFVVRYPEDNEILVRECEILLAMRDQWTGRGVNWSLDLPMHHWDGIVLGGTPVRVMGLNLTNVGLDGAVPPRLGDLEGLRTLHLNRNRLKGSIPPELGGLPQLRVLALSYNQLSGGLPEELAEAPNLEELWLKGNDLAGAIPPKLGESDNLALVRLGGNQLSGCIPASLRKVEDHDGHTLGLAICESSDASRPGPQDGAAD